MNYTNTTINERELFILNHKGWIYGTLYDDFCSADHLMYRFTFRDPKGIVLGDLSKTDFLYNYQNDKRNYYLGYKMQNINNENLIARQELMEYFKKDFAKSLLYFKQPKDYICALADFKNYSKIFDPNLTSAYYACYQESTKLFYGGIPKMVVEEDLAINMGLIDLQKCLFETLEKYKKLASLNTFQPCKNLADFSIHFKSIAQAYFTETLYDKKCQYSASVFRKIHELYDENILLMPNHLVDLTYSYA